MFAPFYFNGYISAKGVLYCPSTKQAFLTLAGQPADWEVPGVTINAGYGSRPGFTWTSAAPCARASGFFSVEQAATNAVISDWFSTKNDVDRCHRDGMNVLYGDGSARWVPRSLYESPLQLITGTSPPSCDAANYYCQIWRAFDAAR
jgi:prepilin-type processing-associated H-X9-DG protein